MQPILKRIISSIACLAIIVSAAAQSKTCFVAGNFSEKVLAQLWVQKVLNNNKYKRIASYEISPENGKFVFAIPKDSGGTYKLQINFYTPGERHPKLERICVLPLRINADRNYTLNIAPSKLDTIKKTGWELNQDNTKSTNALISGKIDGGITKYGAPLNLETVANGSLISRCSFEANNEGYFTIPVQLKKEGFYYLSSPRWRIRVFLKPADKLDLNIENTTGAITRLNGSVENQILFKWQQLISPITSYGYNRSTVNIDSLELDTYISNYKKLQPAMEEFMNNVDMTDARMVELLTDAMKIDRDLAPINLLFHMSVKHFRGYRPTPKDFDEVPDFYKQQFIGPGKFKSASILQFGEAIEFVNQYAKLNLAVLPKERRETMSKAEKLKVMMNAIVNDTLKSYFFKSQMDDGIEINNLSEFRATIEPLKQYAKLPEVNKKYQELFSFFSGDTSFIGKSSYDFVLKDTSGKAVTMKDYQGKIILIDVWATWCGPCKAEIPFLKIVEEEYKDNKDVVFMGISVDRPKERQKWIDFIKKENLAGVQLIDENWENFAKKYQINAIPRFLLIDRQGKWIEIRCPRPSNKEAFKSYINKALQNG